MLQLRKYSLDLFVPYRLFSFHRKQEKQSAKNNLQKAGDKLSGEAGPLKDAYNTLNDRYPDSEWAQRTQPYRLL
jgi:hypothetical protein